MEVITFTLRDGQPRSDQYYLDLASFTDIVINEAKSSLGWLMQAFQTYLSKTGRDPLRSMPEYLLELLTLGVLCKVYASRSGSLPRAIQPVLVAWVSLRKKNARLKPIVDGLRSLLNGLFLWSGDPGVAPPPNTPSALDNLLLWLSASGDFPQEVLRLSAWRDFFQALSPEQAQLPGLHAAG